mmetsp:Transcript_7840/g.20372  ORF Transcript_7840/g.20372 Transcript_7840/m.20372 type:complete len:310 (-) Transcript_7840:584-1513(-)
MDTMKVCLIFSTLFCLAYLATSKTVLVLGSGGFIGSHLTEKLKEDGHNVLEVRNRRHIDLREEGSLDVFRGEKIDFVFFLACEVGGAKFIDSSATERQQIIIENNLRIYNNVFPFLKEKNIPFLFTSSYLSVEDSAYGSIKRVGEAWTKAIEGGRSVRFWNVYGHEENIGMKSHVVADWASQCVEKGVVSALTTGIERRQFVHVRDAVKALCVLMSQDFKEVDKVTDISSGEWISIRQLGEALEQASAGTCSVNFGTKLASHRRELQPYLHPYLMDNWSPSVSLDAGLREALSYYKAQKALSKNGRQDL